MSTNHNRIKVADLEKNEQNKILTTNSNGELEFSDINSIKIESYNALDYIVAGKALDARQGKVLKDLIDDANEVLASDNVDLNTLQKLGDAIETVRTSLNTVSNDISNIQASNYNALDYIHPGKMLDARQGKVLKDLIDDANELLTSDNADLNTLQKLGDALEMLRNSLSTILVNDLTTGGTTKALTAEMGKILQNNKVDKVSGKSLLSDTEITRLGTLSNYVHPANHPASIITQDSGNRFVSDAEKASWNSKQSALGYTAENASNKNIANGYAGLGADGKLISSQLPAITVNDTFVIASEAAMLALTAETGDIAVRTDLSKSFILKGSNSASLNDWQELLTPTSEVTKVFGRNGAVTAQAGDYNADQITETGSRRFQTPSQQANNDATSSIQTQLDSKPSTTGSGASGTWGINITGNANTLGGLDSSSFMKSKNENGYYGMARASDGDTSDWIRTTVNGLIPYQSGNSGSLGTSSWNFNSIYGATIYENNVSLSSKYLGINDNAKTATTLSSNRYNWLTNGVSSTVVGQLSWNNYGNNHTIFDASSGLSPDNSPVSNSNSQQAWTPSYPSLMGWNGTYTYGLRVDSSRISDRSQRANGNFYIDDDYGNGIVGIYSPTRYQGIYAMGDSFKLSNDGTSTNNCYGLSWTHSNVGGESKPGLSHQLLVLEAGVTKTAIGTGLWTSGAVTTTQSSIAGNFGALNLWAGGSYPTLFSSHPDRWTMYANPHICYTENGQNGFTGSMTGATLRFAGDPNASSNWDVGIGTNNVGRDSFSIGRNGSSYFRLSPSSGNADFSMSVVAPAFYGSGNGLTGTAGSLNIGGNAETATSSRRIAFTDGPRTLSDRLPNTFARSVNFDFVNSAVVGGSGNYGGVMTFSPWDGTTSSTGDSSYQLAFRNETGVNGSGLPGLRLRKGIDTTWNGWYDILHSGNYSAYSAFSGAITGSSLNVTGDVTAFSDARVKENIRPIESVIERIQASRGVVYDRIDNEQKDNIGFIAQELEENFPELVLTREDGTKAVKYQNAVAVLFEAVKQQQLQLEEQDKKLKFIIKHLNLNE
ncbi:hypothetical protein HYN56_11025 [Flavobacterium crocinum]|uniref:Peptidase S74 domain-containing protein n=1 Tax=Flavobacterium crocinum TaxID=2183896 RepID=A0A2S1YL43_9FLAO|nr:tail fiber domain-containing protein [Flavobacterium crocinum]AWK04726.1 hypothetical protein HYN56_11025 [Flavobacterium crocinum]